MLLAPIVLAAWIFGALAVGRLASTRGLPILPTVGGASGVVLLLAGAFQLVPIMAELVHHVDFRADDDPYRDTYYIVGYGPYLAQFGLVFLILAAVARWIARKGGQRTNRLFSACFAAFHVSAGTMLALPMLATSQAFGADHALRVVVIAGTLMPQIGFLALVGVLVSVLLTLRRVLLQRS